MHDPITLNLEVRVEVDGEVATVHCPEELRITERAATVLHQALEARGLRLKKWVLSEDQQKDLEGLTNVKVEGHQEAPENESEGD
jgi:hypothetical protein